ncbi:hypothetical protein PanWU01x14_328130 [Parasponia andersonii]|uniref:Uncharacterized protein n=1 Tax=Parasponia andersonii TaxID=3476 RepID=A0A2P5AIT2_PARAD|nr:hypothetical protein PanWU01x14_328130 [Parasponia andersonii]
MIKGPPKTIFLYCPLTGSVSISVHRRNCDLAPFFDAEEEDEEDDNDDDDEVDAILLPEPDVSSASNHI